MTQIHWTNPVSGEFSTAADWTGDVVPGAGDDALLDAAGAPYTVTATGAVTVDSIQTAANASLFVATGRFTAATGTGSGANAGTITISDVFNETTDFFVKGALANAGTIALVTHNGRFANNSVAQMIVEGPTTLSGGGTLLLSETGGRAIITSKGRHAVLTNVDNTISGNGDIGDSSTLAVINEAGGVIDAGDATLHSDLGLTAATTTNAGLIEATGGGYLVIGGSVTNTGGVIEANGGSRIVFANGATQGGQLNVGGGGSQVVVDPGDTMTDAALSVAAGSLFEIASTATVTAHGVIANSGQLAFDGAGTLDLDGDTTLTGAGTVDLGQMDVGEGQIEAVATGVTLTNAGNTISGAGQIGGALTLINQAAGVIEAHYGAMTIDTGTSTVANAGLIECATQGSMLISGSINNTGTLETAGGTITTGETLTVDGRVSGAGSAMIGGGELHFNAGVNEKVFFTGSTGILALAKSQLDHQAIAGFSTTGGTSLDLEDIAFVSAEEATYSGTKAKGVLTVTDGTNTALINLKGNYLGATFTASSDGHDGVDIVATTPPGAAAGRFIAAAAALGGQAGGSMSVAEEAARRSPTMLARPEVREA